MSTVEELRALLAGTKKRIAVLEADKASLEAHTAFLEADKASIQAMKDDYGDMDFASLRRMTARAEQERLYANALIRIAELEAKDKTTEKQKTRPPKQPKKTKQVKAVRKPSPEEIRQIVDHFGNKSLLGSAIGAVFTTGSLANMNLSFKNVKETLFDKGAQNGADFFFTLKKEYRSG